MKPKAIRTAKFKMLCKRLNSDIPTVIGHLELLWMATAENHPDGGIGRLTNEEIGALCEWGGEPDEFVEALVACRWLELHSEARLIVHDWRDHCPTWVKANMVRHGRDFCNSTRDATKEPTKEVTREPPKEPPKDATRDGPTSSSSSSSSSSSKKKEENLVLRAQNGRASRHSYSEHFELFWRKYATSTGKRVGKKETYAEWKKIPEEQRDEVIESVEPYAAFLRRDMGGRRPPKDPVRFLRGGFWSSPWEEMQEPQKHFGL